MALKILSLQLGPMENNTYLIADEQAGKAVVIDPSFESEAVLDEINRHSWALEGIWLTHAHFDHIAGIRPLVDAFPGPLPIGLHPGDLDLWREGGGARNFGLVIEPGPEPTLLFTDGQSLQLGESTFMVRHTPGHTAGHVIFYAPAESVAFCGDVIFYRGIGRTDLPGGNHARLLKSIREKVLTLPGPTRLLSGHGPETTVEEEAAENPFL